MKCYLINKDMKDCIIHAFEFIQILMTKGKIRKDDDVFEAINHIVHDLKLAKEIEVFEEGEEK